MLKVQLFLLVSKQGEANDAQINNYIFDSAVFSVFYNYRGKKIGIFYLTALKWSNTSFSKAVRNGKPAVESRIQHRLRTRESHVVRCWVYYFLIWDISYYCFLGLTRAMQFESISILRGSLHSCDMASLACPDWRGPFRRRRSFASVWWNISAVGRTLVTLSWLLTMESTQSASLLLFTFILPWRRLSVSELFHFIVFFCRMLPDMFGRWVIPAGRRVDTCIVTLLLYNVRMGLICSADRPTSIPITKK